MSWAYYYLPILALAQLLSYANAYGASYNESCGDEVRCDFKNGYFCFNTTCQCITTRQSVLRYDPVQEKCLALSSGKCELYVSQKVTKEGKSSYETTYLVVDCVANATCREVGKICECDPGYFENAEKLCTLKLLKGEKCTQSSQCRSDLGLICDAGYCKLCNETDSIFDSERKRCVGLAGASCTKYDSICLENAFCWRNNYYGDVCECGSRYEKSEDGFCLGKYNSECSTDSPCSDDFICVDKRCKCEYPDHQYYDDKEHPMQKCISYVRGPCHERIGDDFKNYTCIENATCANSTGIFECACKEGMVESGDRKCKIDYGGSCESSSDCDGAVGLECKNGKCLCGKDFEIYDFEAKTCPGLVGAQCDNEVYCVKDTVCDKYRDSKLKNGTCRCSPGFKTNWGRRCVAI